MKHVINTESYIGVIANMSTASQVALAKEVAARSKTKRDQLEQRTVNKLKEVEDLAKEAERKAGILDDFEKGQIESALKELVQTEGMQAVLDAVRIDLGGGQVVSLPSVIVKLANADKVAKSEPSHDENGTFTGEKLTLVDDTIVLMEATPTEQTNGDIRFDVVAGGDNKWKGIDASYHFVLRPIKSTETIEGEPYEVTKRIELVEKTNIVFDLSAGLEAAGSLNTDVDLNGDGQIGNTETPVDPEPEPESVDPSASDSAML